MHVNVSKAYCDRFFPDPAKLKSWWRDHKDELIANRQKQLKAKNTPPGKLSQELTAHRKKLESRSQGDIEAQYYALQGKQVRPSKVKYEDRILLKIEKLHLRDVQFHAVDDAGHELRDWHHRLHPD